MSGNKSDFNAVLNPNQTSASLLVRYARFVAEKAEDKERGEKKLLVVYDLYIKARSYAFWNKLFFILSIIASFSVLIWPSVGVIVEGFGKEKGFLASAIIQTTITGLAALMFTFYSQYKNKQTYMENLMRYAVFSEESVNVLSRKIIEEMVKIDKGFSFSEVLSKKEK